MHYNGGDTMAKNKKARNNDEEITKVQNAQLTETGRLIERAKDIDPLDDDYITIQERIADANKSSENIGKLKGKGLSKLEVMEKITGIGVGVAGIALTVKEICGGMVRSDGAKTILRNCIGSIGKIVKK
jgi:hypothetical protein